MKKIKKYLKILWLFAKVSFMMELAYRPSFFLAVMGKTLRMLVLLIFFQAIFFNTRDLAGWDFSEIFLLVTTYLTIESIMIITFHRNLSYYFPDMLRKGNFDFLLTKPINILFYTSFRVIDLMDLTSSLTVGVLWIYYFSHFEVNFSLVNVLLYLMLMVNALIFVFSLLLLISSTAFWTISATGLGRFFENMVRVARFPSDIFQGAAKVFLAYVIPISIIATIPVKTFLGVISWPFVVFAFLFTLVLFFLALNFWHYALKHYSSASS